MQNAIYKILYCERFVEINDKKYKILLSGASEDDAERMVNTLSVSKKKNSIIRPKFYQKYSIIMETPHLSTVLNLNLCICYIFIYFLQDI